MNLHAANESPLLRGRHRRRRRRPRARLRASLRRPRVVRAADGAPEVNAWVVIRPDDTVVIRIARSEMGQGTLTGLAQLVAEELECDWSKVTTEFPTPGQNVARKRAWGDFSTGGSRGIRTSQEYVRKGGAAARMMLIQAAANEWKVPASECSAANSVITHTAVGTHHHLRQGGRGRRQARAAQADIKLKDPKDWKIAGKGAEAARYRRQDSPASMVYGIDIKLPGMLNAAIKDCPVIGGKLKSFDEAKVTGMQGVKKVVRVGDTRRRRRRRHLVARQDRARRAADRLGRRRERQGLQRLDREMAGGRARSRAPAFVGNKNGDAQGRDRRRRQEGRGGLQLSLPEPRHHGADERHGALYRRQMRGLVRHAERRGGASPRCSRPPACRPTNATCTSRSSAAASAGAARPTMSGRRCRSPSRCRARRSSCSGRAKRTCSTAPIIRSRNAR